MLKIATRWYLIRTLYIIRWTCHDLLDAQTFRQAFDECRLATTQITDELDDITRFYQLGKLSAER